MKKQKINIEEVCKAYNLAREEYKGKKGDSEWIIKILKENGISGSLAKRMLGQSTLFQQFVRTGQGRGRHLGYIWPSGGSVYKEWFKNWLYPPVSNNAPVGAKKEQSFEEECAEYLRKQGYKLKKLVGFDEDAFKEAYPQLWEKFLIYEEV